MNDEPIDGGWLDEAEVIDDSGGGSTPGDDYGSPGGGGSPGSGSGGEEQGEYEPEEPEEIGQPTEEEILNEAGYWSYVDGKFVWTVNGGTLQEVTISVSTGYAATDAIGVMLSSMGLSASHADVAAAIMKLETKGFTIASRSFGVLGALQNVNQMYQSGDWNWRDTAQAALAVGLVLPGVNGAIAIGGGAILFGWELYELMNE